MRRLLNMEMIPWTSWYDNVRSRVSHGEWEWIRMAVMKEQCQYCGQKNRLFCHEDWEYDDVNYIQKLVGFETVCFLCHSVHHIGLAELMAERGDLDMVELIKHYRTVNGCSLQDFQEDRKEAELLWLKRSEHDWTLDLSYLDKLYLVG